MSELELKPCKRCGHKPQQAFGYGQQRYFCLHCCHEFEKSVTSEWSQTEEEARNAWNAMQEDSGQDVPEKEAESTSWAELVDFLIDRLFVKIKAVATEKPLIFPELGYKKEVQNRFHSLTKATAFVILKLPGLI